LNVVAGKVVDAVIVVGDAAGLIRVMLMLLCVWLR
jgi:hypothetical protein